MILLILEVPSTLAVSVSFKFHYDSINSLYLLLFTVNGTNLNSIMILLIPRT